MSLGKWRVGFKFYKPIGKTNVYFNFIKFTLFDVRISDLSGEIILCNISFEWRKVFKAKEREMKGIVC